MARSVVYQRPDCKWGWRLRADNDQIIATDGSQGYEKEAVAREMADRVLSGEFADATKVRMPDKECEKKGK